MKKDIIDKLRSYKDEINSLKREIKRLSTKQVNKKKHRDFAESIASKWVEEIRSPLEHKFKIDKSTIEQTSDEIKKLHVLSRPNNLKSSYISCLNRILKNYDNKFILPIQQSTDEINEISDLHKLLATLSDEEESEYMKEAVDCAEAGYCKAAIVMGWCATIDKIQKKIMSLGFNSFNNTSKKIKNKTSGKFKRWNKEFNISTLSELQEVFDTDIIVIIEAMGLIDSNQAQRLETCFQYRNHSAHPGQAPIEPANVVSFFSDINKIVIQNPSFS